MSEGPCNGDGRLVALVVLLAAVLCGCPRQIQVGTVQDGSPSVLDGGLDSGVCVIGGQAYASRELDPSDRSRCCNPATSSSWSEVFVRGPSYSLQNISDLRIADLNGDGRTDIVLTDQTQFYLYLNNGDGTFTNTTTLSFVGTLSACAVDDMNGDGRPDLVVARRVNTTYSVGVLLNDGDGGFADEVDVDATCFVDRLALGDFNGDGWQDVFAGEDSPCGPGIFTNAGRGDGKIGAEMLYSPTFGYMAGIAVGDFNGDGWMDFTFNDGHSGGATYIYLNDGGGVFGAPFVNNAVSFPWYTAVGRLGDGEVDDMVVTGKNSGESFVIGKEFGGLRGRTTFSPGDLQAAVADLNGDGLQDFVLDDEIGNVYLFFNQGGGAFWSPAMLSTGVSIQSLSIADLNGDGAPDLVIATYDTSNPKLTIWYAGYP